MVPRPEMILDRDRKWSPRKTRNAWVEISISDTQGILVIDFESQ